MNRKSVMRGCSRGTGALQSPLLLGRTGNSDSGMMSSACTYIAEQCDITSCILIHSTLCWHLLHSHGILCVLGVCACAQREIIASPRGGKKLFNRGAHGGKAISNNVLFLQQQLCLTPMVSAAHYLSSHLFLHHLPPCLDIHQQQQRAYCPCVHAALSNQWKRHGNVSVLC